MFQNRGLGDRKMKKSVFIAMLSTILCCSFVGTPAWAGDKQRHRWEGVAIGIGAVILGNALLNGCYYSQPPPVVYHRPAPVYYTPAPVYYSPAPVYYRPCRPVFVYYTPPPPRHGVHRKLHHGSRYARCAPRPRTYCGHW